MYRKLLLDTEVSVQIVCDVLIYRSHASARRAARAGQSAHDSKYLRTVYGACIINHFYK